MVGREGAVFNDQVEDPICEGSLRKEVDSEPGSMGHGPDERLRLAKRGSEDGTRGGFVTRKKALERGGVGSDDGSQRESISGVEAVSGFVPGPRERLESVCGLRAFRGRSVKNPVRRPVHDCR